jgi:hypothetical protein
LIATFIVIFDFASAHQEEFAGLGVFLEEEGFMGMSIRGGA